MPSFWKILELWAPNHIQIKIRLKFQQIWNICYMQSLFIHTHTPLYMYIYVSVYGGGWGGKHLSLLTIPAVLYRVFWVLAIPFSEEESVPKAESIWLPNSSFCQQASHWLLREDRTLWHPERTFYVEYHDVKSTVPSGLFSLSDLAYGTFLIMDLYL